MTQQASAKESASQVQVPLAKRIKKWIFRALLGGAGLLFILGILGAVWTQQATRRFYADNPQPGQMVDVGTHKLHAVVMGSGSTTVVFDAGVSDGGTYSCPPAKQVSEFAKVCTFDRAGYGWSECGPIPRTPFKCVEEQRELLKKLELTPPYILVGSSYGGAISRLFASLFPDEVAGLVLVDAVNFDVAKAEELDAQPNVLIKLLDATRHVGSLRAFEKAGLLPAADPADSAEIEKVNQFKLEMMLVSKHFHAFVDEIEGAKAAFPRVVAKTNHLGMLPVTVIAPKRYEGFLLASSWDEGRDKLQTISENIRVLPVDCGHSVSTERPDVVVEAVREILERVKDNPNPLP